MKKDIIEIDFTSQINAQNKSDDCSCAGNCDSDCSCPCHGDPKESEGDEIIAFSVRIVEALTSKAEDHNRDENNSPVTFEELLEAYRRGANMQDIFEGRTLGELAMARVNLLLRVKSRRFKDILTGVDEEKTAQQLSGLIFDQEDHSISINSELDMFDSWAPQEGDFIKARKDIEKYNLDYDFKNINELYLNKYEQIPLEFD
jgi:hypothetical protein